MIFPHKRLWGSAGTVKVVKFNQPPCMLSFPSLSSVKYHQMMLESLQGQKGTTSWGKVFHIWVALTTRWFFLMLALMCLALATIPLLSCELMGLEMTNLIMNTSESFIVSLNHNLMVCPLKLQICGLCHKLTTSAYVGWDLGIQVLNNHFQVIEIDPNATELLSNH